MGIKVCPERNRHGEPPSFATLNQTCLKPTRPKRVTPSGTWYYAFAAYALGTRVHAVAGPVGFASLLLAAAFLVWLFVFMRRNEARLEQEAERAIPGPLAVG